MISWVQKIFPSKFAPFIGWGSASHAVDFLCYDGMNKINRMGEEVSRADPDSLLGDDSDRRLSIL